MKTASALFDTFNDANNAVQDLFRSGFTRDEVSLVSSNNKSEFDTHFDNEGRYINSGGASTTTIRGDTGVAADLDIRTQEKSGTSFGDKPTVDSFRDDLSIGEGAATGAGIGATLGGLGGILMGLGLLVIPGVGPALAAGAIASALVGAGIGGAVGGISGALVNAGVPEDEVDYYSEGVRRGGHLVVVSSTDDREVIARDILQRYNPVSVRERADIWRKDGWERFDPNALPYDQNGSNSMSAGERERVLRHEERTRL